MLSEEMSFDELLDASGLECPMPLLKAKLALNKMTAGGVLKVIATDIGSVRDIPAYVDLSSHKLIASGLDSSPYIFFIQRA